MFPPTLFDTLGHTFMLKPLLVTGKAMEYYGLRQGNDYDFVVPQEEFRRLLGVFRERRFTTPLGETGIRVGSYEFYSSLYGLTYYQLEREAINQQDYLIIHLELLLFLKTLTTIHEPENKQARQDMRLLMQKLGVWSPVSPIDLPEEEHDH